MTGRDLRIATGLGGSVRDPLVVGEVTMTARGHAIPLAALVTARGHGSSRFFPLTIRSHRREADEPDGSNRKGGKTVTVSQAPIVSEASATVAPPVVGGIVFAVPSAVQDLAKFFLSLTGSSSQGSGW